MLDEDIDTLINRNKFSRTQINHFKAKDSAYKQSLSLLRKHLQQLEEGSLEEYRSKLVDLDNEWRDRMNIIQTWYETKKAESDNQYESEYKNAINEYSAKCKELKDNLRSEYEEKRKLIEIEKNSLDINMDVTDVKPTVTRKLRRRANEQTPISTATSNLSLLATILNPTPMSVGASSQSGHTTTTQSVTFFAQTIPSYVVNERKRRPSPATQIQCTLNDDEINDDLKYLSKNYNSLPQQVLLALNSDINSSNDEMSNKSPTKSVL